jgi:ribosomal protein RSM22 (predicted rRNA methylase)
MNAPTTRKLAKHAEELRELVDWFEKQELSLASVETLTARVRVIADRMAVDPRKPKGHVVVDLGDFSRKAVG